MAIRLLVFAPEVLFVFFSLERHFFSFDCIFFLLIPGRDIAALTALDIDMLS
ncbi:hypothetical protein D3C84_1219950 [compost metagenome]